MAEHTNQTTPFYKCDFCEKKFKLNFSYNRHIQKYHSCQSTNSSPPYECNKKSDPSLQLSKYECIWKSKNNIYKCTICFEQFDCQNNLVDHMYQQHSEDSINTNVLKCQICNTKFKKVENLHCHLLYCTNNTRNIWNKVFSNAENNEINSYDCTVCGVTFSHLLLLKSHMTSGCKSHSCSCCGKTFITKDLWLNHITNNEKHEECVKLNSNNNNNNKTPINKVNLVEYDYTLKIKKEKHTDTNISVNSSSDCVGTDNYNDLIVQNVSHTLTVNNCSPDKNNDKITNNQNILPTTNRKRNILDCADADNSSDSITQNLSRNSEINNCDLNINKKKNILVCMDPENSNSILHKNSSHNSEVNNYRLISSNVSESNSADCLYSNHNLNSPYTILPHNLILKKEPGYFNSDDIERSNQYFSIEKLSNTNLSVNATNLNCEQISQSDVDEYINLFTCNICKMSSTTNKDSFALHMSSHLVCGIHECVVCNQVFNTVKHLKDHMNYHQTQINLHLSELLQSGTEYSEAPMKPQTVLKTPKSEINYKFENSPMEIRSTQICIKKTKSMFRCNICLKILPSKLTLMAHRTIHSESSNTERQLFSCKFCNMKFNNSGPCIKHEKLHNHLNNSKLILLNAPVIKVESKSYDLIDESTEDNKRAFCTLCNKQFGHNGALTNHMKIHSRGNLYICNQCDKSFRSKRILLRHINAHLNENLVKNIDIENIEIEKNEEQKQNSENSLKNNNMLFDCDVCEMKFSSADQLIVHRKIHKNKPYLCTICGRLYAYKFYWDTHLKNHSLMSNETINNSKSDHQNIFKCENCKNEYKIKSEWKKHLLLSKDCCHHYNTNRSKYRSIQTKEDCTKCNICLKTYSNRYNLQVHLKNVHKQINIKNENYQCIICSKQFLTAANLKQHIACIHSNENIICNVCGKVYKHIQSYKLHLKYSKLHNLLSDKAFAKNKIQYSVSNNQNVTAKHVQNDAAQSTSNKPSVKFCNSPVKCEICFKILKSQKYLSAHMRLHSGVTPFKCLYCNAQFRFKSNLRLHCKTIHSIKIKIRSLI